MTLYRTLRTPRILILALAALLLALSGCGYALVGRASNLPPDIKTVYLKPFDNRTQRSQVEQFVTRSIADELVRRQRFAVVGSPTGADAEIAGAVVGYGATPITFDNTGRATQYEISIVCQISFKRTGADKPLWANDRYNFRETYPVDASTGFVDFENTAIDRASKRFAQTVVSDLLEGF
ncbi:MAG TPA: LptE family protein [Thermoanaerobaculia bacterium]|jgi:outer membrane lipopolysaccharide assembly protein LptE/RlpB